MWFPINFCCITSFLACRAPTQRCRQGVHYNASQAWKACRYISTCICGDPRVRFNTPACTVVGKGWWDWWHAINPEWRRVSDGGLTRDGDGSWDELRCPGQNGFLNVVVCLKWWRLAAGTESGDWVRGVDDVRWVMQQMVG
ncbi:hypothetical protein B0H16DRAFT_1327340 [Mycena metata]|uniref:Uncharacterized protein n=1 Tax=Mycena metata TaxID=1033252 RepID=A0AAD7I662_9AGAR|nr:hypothetical protein B0H16DRAFT_1327340 [Mycena metata]